jgi:hypothetical protein
MRVDIEINLDDIDSDSIKEYCRNKFTIDDIFGDDEIKEYCEQSFNVDDVYGKDKISDAATDYDPEGIFPESSLADWANRNGWRGPN